MSVATVTIQALLSEELIALQLRARDKLSCLEELVGLLTRQKLVRNKARIVKELMTRESLGSTGIGQGIAIPHIKTKLVKEPVAALGISPAGIDFNALDGEAVYIIFLLISPEDAPGPHLKVLARVSKILRDRTVREAFRNASDRQTLLKIIGREEAIVQ